MNKQNNDDPNEYFWPLMSTVVLRDSGKILTQFKCDTFSLLLTKLVLPRSRTAKSLQINFQLFIKKKKNGIIVSFEFTI